MLFGSVGIGADDLVAVPRADRPPALEVDRVLDETDRAVVKQTFTPPGWLLLAVSMPAVPPTAAAGRLGLNEASQLVGRVVVVYRLTTACHG